MCAPKALAKESCLLRDHAHLLLHGCTTTLARKHPFRCKCALFRRGSPLTSLRPARWPRKRNQSGRRCRRNCACNAPSLLRDIAADGGTAGRCRNSSVPQSNGAGRNFPTPLPIGSWQLPAPCIPCHCYRTLSRQRCPSCS